MSRQPAEHVVVIGGGFGGLAVVKELTKRARRELPLRITLIDQRNHHTFQPLLYQVATAGLQPQDIGISLRAILRRRDRITVRLGEVTGVDTAAREVLLADGGNLPYDRLVVAAGAVTADFGVPGVQEYAFGLKSLADATTLRNHILRCFELASADPTHLDDGTLTFVVAGGGPTGVELAGALAELVDLVLRRDHPELDIDRARIVLVEMADRLLGTFSSRSGRIALAELRRRGVEVRVGTAVERADGCAVELNDGEVLPTRTLVWAAGIGPSPLATSLGVETDRSGRIPVDDRLAVTGLQRVYAIGDIAGARDPDGDPLPQVAPVAIQQGRHVADVIAAELTGERPPVFRYRDKGSMATVGRAAAVSELPRGIYLRGVPAWLAWLVLHLWMLVGFKNRASVLASWIWNYVTFDHAARLILDQRESPRSDRARGAPAGERDDP